MKRISKNSILIGYCHKIYPTGVVYSVLDPNKYETMVTDPMIMDCLWDVDNPPTQTQIDEAVDDPRLFISRLARAAEQERKEGAPQPQFMKGNDCREHKWMIVESIKKVIEGVETRRSTQMICARCYIFYEIPPRQ